MKETKTMKRARMVNAIVWIAVGIGLSAGVSASWYVQGCGAGSLVAGIVMYVLLCAAMWFVFDQAIQGK